MKNCFRFTLVILMVFFVSLVSGNGIVGFIPPNIVSSDTQLAMDQWLVVAGDIGTACNGGPCCIAPATPTECRVLAVGFRDNPSFWVDKVTAQFQAVGPSFECLSYSPVKGSNRKDTACTLMANGGPLLGEVAKIASVFAAQG